MKSKQPTTPAKKPAKKARKLKLFVRNPDIPVSDHWTRRQKARVLALLDGGNRWIKGALRTDEGYCALGAMKKCKVILRKRKALTVYFPLGRSKKSRDACVLWSFPITMFNDNDYCTLRKLESRLLRIPTVEDLS